MNKNVYLRLVAIVVLTIITSAFGMGLHAQTSVFMNHSGTEKVGHTDIQFYDNGGPSLGPDYYWERWYSHNLDYTITFEPKVSTDKIKVTFNTFEAYSDNGGTNHAIGNWALRINDDHLYIYDGPSVDPDKLIADLTGSIRNEFSVMADGPMTFHFVTNNHFREEGWAATVQYFAGDFTPEPPIILKDVCGTDINLFANPGYEIYYTTNGDEPTSSSTPYTGSFEINLELDPSNVTVKAIATDGTTTTDVASVLFTHNDYVPDPHTPTITISGNTVTMTTDAPPGYLNETYNIYYSTTGGAPWTLYDGPFEWTTPNTIFTAFTRAYSCEEKQSETVTDNFTTVTVPNPVISFNNSTDQATITCSLPGSTIYYTTDGSTPTSSSTTYSSPFSVSLGTTVKAIAYSGTGTGYTNSGFSSVVSAIYTKGKSGGVSGNIVFLDDREDHSWSYYSDGTQPIHSLNPADVKITYFGYGPNTMTSTDNTDNPTTFDANVPSTSVAVNVGEPGNQFVYLKTLENANADGSGNYPYTMIPNPFQVRPLYNPSRGDANGDDNNSITFSISNEVRDRNGNIVARTNGTNAFENNMGTVTPMEPMRGENTLLSAGFESGSSASINTTTYQTNGWYAYNAGSGNNWGRTSGNANNGSYKIENSSNRSNPSNCYLVSEPFTVSGDMTQLYVELYARVSDNSYNASFEVFLVKASDVTTLAGVASATQYTAIPSNSYNNTSYTLRSGTVTNSALAGQSVRVVVHCTSAAAGSLFTTYYLRIDDITVKESTPNTVTAVAGTNISTAYVAEGSSFPSGATTTVLNNVTNGSSVTFQATPNSGYVFAGWYNESNNLVSTNNPYTCTASTNLTLTAKGLPSYTVSAAAGTGISTAYVAAGSSFSGTETSVSVAEGGSATFQATVASGYGFTGWYDESNNLVSNSLTYTANDITGDFTLTAKAGRVYTVTITSPSNGTVTVSPNPVAAGSTATLTVTPNSGYSLGSLTVTGNTSSNTYTVSGALPTYTFTMPDENVTVNATFFQKTSNSYRGFYAWRVKNVSDGLSIKVGNTTYTTTQLNQNHPIISADQNIEFITSNKYDNEVEFEALWAKAYVVDTRAGSSGNYYYTVTNTSVGCERNFVVLQADANTYKFGGDSGNRIANSNNQAFTVTTRYPDGSAGTSAGKIGNSYVNLTADTKFENIDMAMGSNNLGGAGHNLTMGRGVTPNTANTVGVQYLRGIITAPSSGDVNYTIRLESGTYERLQVIDSINAKTFPGKVTTRVIIGCDYDRARGDNNNLHVAPNKTIYGCDRPNVFPESNRNNLTYDWIIKSGKIHENKPVGDGGGSRSVYLGNALVGANSVQYLGRRRLTMEGGEIANIAGGVDDDASSYVVNDGGWTVLIRLKGGTVRGSIYGAAAFGGAAGDRQIVCTGGQVNGWIAGGCNGTQSSGGELFGDTYIYFGGNAMVGSSSGGTHVGGDTGYGTNGADGGHIFGAGCGILSGTSYTEDSFTVGRVNHSNVVVADSATVWGNVYGGGNYGRVRAVYNPENPSLNGNVNITDPYSKIYILGGEIKASSASGREGEGDVFGGANRNKGQWVYITMRGGTVGGNIYGGSNDWGFINHEATITISGGTVTNVFGAGKGSGTDMKRGTEVNVSGGTIIENVYGGGEEGTVSAGNTVVNVTGGKVNDVFGAGQGTLTDALVTGTTTVTIDGGTVLGTVYGGGEAGKQIGEATVNIVRGEVRGDVFGGALGTTGQVFLAGKHTVNVTGGHVFGNLYGGSKRANDALALSGYDDDEQAPVCITNISGGRLDRHVHAAGYFGHSYGSVYIFIGQNAIQNAPNHAYSGTAADFEKNYPIANLRIARSVWAGADWGSTGGFDGTKFTITGYSNIYVDGTGYDTGSNNASNATYMNIGESLYASGNSSEAAAADHRFIIVRNYGAPVDNPDGGEEPYSEASRTFYSIQRPTYLVFDNAHINLSGQGRINSTVSTEQYGIYEVCEALYLANGSSLFLDAPATQMKKFVSASNANVYANTTNSGPASYNPITTSTLSATPNKVRVGGGNYLKVYHDKMQSGPKAGYGELSGFSYLMTSDDTNETALIYARPKQCVPTHIDNSNDNPGDGGWVAYKTSMNTFTLGEYSGSEWNPEPTAGGTDQVAYENHILTDGSKAGEDHFRIWRTDGNESYREGVLNAKANGEDTFSTTDAVVPLPPFRKAGNYYRIQTKNAGATSIVYGADVRTYNAASYGDPSGANWMYCNTTPSQVTGLASDNSNLEAAINSINSMPDVNFGMVILPSQGFSTTTNYIICQESDELLAASTTKFQNAQNGAEPQVTFRLTYSNTLKTNASYDPMTVILEQVDPSDDNKVVDRVTIVLGVNTITSIEETQYTDLYAIMRGTGINPSDYTAKIVLPTFGIYDPETPSTFKVKSVTFVGANEGEEDPSNVGNLVARNGTFNHNNFAVTFNAAQNSDHTNGWFDMTSGEKDAYTLLNNNNSANYYTIGTAQGREPLAIDFHLYYDGTQTVTYSKGLMGTLTFNMEFNNYKDSDGNLEDHQTLTIKVKVYRRGQGNSFYIDGVNGLHSNDGRNPDDAVLKLSTIFNRLDFAPGDVIYIVNTVTVGGEEEWSGVDYNGLVTMYRYPGHHKLKDGTEPASTSPYYDAFTGPLVNVASGGDLLINDITIDGHRTSHTVNASINPSGTDAAVTAQAPLITVEDGGMLRLDFDALLQNNNNGSESVNGGGVNVAEGGTVMMNSNAKITGNVSSEGGGVYMDGSLIVSDEVNIYNNSSSSSSIVQNNVLLTAPVKVVQIGTNTTDDYYGPLTSSAKIGVTKSAEGHEEGRVKVTCVEEESDKDWLEVPYVRPNTVIVHDEGRYQLEKYTDNRILYWLINTWVAVVTSNPNDPSPFDPTNIDTEEKLAWLISLVNGENSQTPNNFSGQTVTLTGDLDMSEYLWDPIGNSLNSTSFKGTFDGNGHTIEGLSSSLVRDNLGLFGLTENATIQNVTVDVDFSGEASRIGGIVGKMEGGTVSNCEAVGSITATGTDQIIGGLAGSIDDGSIHSSFAVTEMMGDATTVMGGLVGTNGNGTSGSAYLFNSYSCPTIIGGGSVGGLVGINNSDGWVENCYSIVGAQTFPAFAGSNAGTIKVCYADRANGYVGSGTAATLHGTYSATLDRKALGYMYYDNLIAKNTNTYVGDKDAATDGISVYLNNHTPVWNGLLCALNNWVVEKNGGSSTAPYSSLKPFTIWFRPTTKNINGDLPILGYSTSNSVATMNSDGRKLEYSNSLDGLLTTYNAKATSSEKASLFLYSNAIDVANVPSDYVDVFVNEDACLLQSAAAIAAEKDFINTTVGITFDNSCKNATTTDAEGNTVPLNYDWHLMSSPLSDAPMGITYNDSPIGYGEEVNISSMTGNYFPNSLRMGAEYDDDVQWDLYSYFEPEYHWINLKRSGNNHWHFDEPHGQINYNGGGDDNTNETIFIPGKGYMMAISQDSYMSGTGILNRGDVKISLTHTVQDHDWEDYFSQGCNLIGNPYQAYLDLNEVTTRTGYNTFFIYDADMNSYVPYKYDMSENEWTPSQYIHPHQAFFVMTARGENQQEVEDFTFTRDMATTDITVGSYYRGGKVNYPLVNLFVENEQGAKNYTIVEVGRPELGGAEKSDALKTTNFDLYAHYGEGNYKLLFTPAEAQRVPVFFRTEEDGNFTITWDTYHGPFHFLRLIDNIAGTECDMLANDHYSFYGQATDYAARFYLVFDNPGEDPQDPDSTEHPFAFNDGYGWIVNGSGQLQLVDVLGRVLHSEYLPGEMSRVNFDRFAAGAYVLRLSGSQGVKTQKIVID